MSFPKLVTAWLLVCGIVSLGFTQKSFSAPVATIGSEAVDESEVQSDEAIFEYNKQEIDYYFAKLGKLNEVLFEKLVAKEAPGGVEKYIEKNVKNKVKDPSEKKVDETLARVPPQNKPQDPSQMPEFRARVKEMLRGQEEREVKDALLNKLKSKYKVKVTMAPALRKLPSGTQASETAAGTGKKDAKVVIVAFSDFQCPYCARALEPIEKIKKAYGKSDVSIMFRHFPLSFHKRARPTAIASVCAQDQGKFWQFHDMAFKNQSNLEDSDLKNYARRLDLNIPKFTQCIESAETAKRVDTDQETGEKIGVRSTPTFIVNGKPVAGALPFEIFKSIIDADLAL